MSRLSVLMPVRNGERFLRPALDSVLRALPDDAELVVLDDASSDGTAEVLASYSSKRLVVLTADAPMGVASGLDYLIEQTDSEFVGRMDADDIALPWRFLRQLRLLKQYDVVFSSICYIDARGMMRRPDLPGPIRDESMALHLLVASFLCHPTMMARRDCLPTRPYREVAAEDYDLWLRLVAAGRRLSRDSVPSYLYREHSFQISRSSSWLESREQDGSADLLVTSYQGLLDRMGIDVGVTRPMLEFVQGGKPRLSDFDCTELGHVFEAVRSRSEAVPMVERLPLRLRLARAENRLSVLVREKRDRL